MIGNFGLTQLRMQKGRQKGSPWEFETSGAYTCTLLNRSHEKDFEIDGNFHRLLSGANIDVIYAGRRN